MAQFNILPQNVWRAWGKIRKHQESRSGKEISDKDPQGMAIMKFFLDISQSW
jgi:hypothetical protein